MGIIRTITGDIDPSDLGITLMHEHIWLNLNENQKLNDYEPIVRELVNFKSLGGRSVVEVTNINMGRNVEKLKEISIDTGLFIVAGTGYYFQDYYPSELEEKEIDEIADLIISEIEEGIGSEKIKAGIIGEVGVSNPITLLEKKVIISAARAQKRTQAPLYIHTTLGERALEVADLILKEGVEPNSFAIGHLDLKLSLDYHTEIAKLGCYLGYDTFGKTQYNSDEKRVDFVEKLVENGYQDKILLSSDVTRPSYFYENGGFGYQHILYSILPEFRKRFNQEIINDLLIKNPARFLEIPK